MRRLAAAGLGTVAFIGWLAVVHACPTCKESLVDFPQAQQVRQTAKGYALSIGLLIGTPMLLVGTVATLIVRHQRRRGVDRSGLSR